MSTFEDLKKIWVAQESGNAHPAYDHRSLENIIKSRMKTNMKKSMQYFWGALFLQILVYALLGHVVIKYGSDAETVALGLGGILVFLPFTVVLMKKFKRMAIAKPEDKTSSGSLYQYVLGQRTLLGNFYTFKRRYEFLLVPMSTAIGVFLTFKLFVPGGVEEHATGAAITFLLTLISMVVSIRMENKKSFEQPIHDLDVLLDEFKAEE